MTIEKLQRGIQELQLDMPTEQQERLLDFLQLLQKWNKSYNLTAITEMDEMITHHALDSLAVAQYLSGERIIDIGTGAGFPGIPLALYFPDKKFTLLDSNGKKTRFLIQAKAALAIDNIEIVHARAETYHTDLCFDAIIFRAVTSVADMIDKTQHLCCEHGQYFAMKGSVPTEELKRIEAPAIVHALAVPGLDAERHLAVIEGVTGD